MKEKRPAQYHKTGWVMPYVKRHGWRIMLAAILGALAVGCGGGLLFVSGYLISRAALQPHNILLLYVPIVLVRTFGLGKAVIQYGERLLSHDTVLRILQAMRIRLYRMLEPQAVYLRSRFQTGDFLGMLAEDIEQLQNIYLRLALPSVIAVLVYGTGITLLGLMDRAFALMMALYCGFLLFTLPACVLLLSRQRRKRHLISRHSLYRELTDAVFGMSDWILSGRTRRVLAHFRKRQAALLSMEKKIRRTEWKTEWITQCGMGGSIVLITLWAAEMNGQGKLAPEWIAAYALVTFPLLESMMRAGHALMTVPNYQESLRRLESVEPPRLEQTQARSPSAYAQLNQAESPGTYKPAQKKAYIHLNQVSYRYPGTCDWSINNLSLQIPKGAHVAVIGRSGSGKSTLFKLLLGELAPSKGYVTIDGFRADMARKHHYFSVINQQPYLFNTSIANNIRLGRPDASDEEIRKAAEQAGLADLIDSLPEGMATLVHETGLRFSGGERQRIALARILLQDRPIVLLDEPTAGLDPLTEHRLVQTLIETLKGKTLIWITHHLTGIESMDQIIFLEQGRIAMQGSHEQLLKTQERYRQFYALDRPLQQEDFFQLHKHKKTT